MSDSRRPIATDYDHLATAKRALSAAIRELMSASVFMSRSGNHAVAETIDRIHDQARAVRSAVEEIQ